MVFLLNGRAVIWCTRSAGEDMMIAREDKQTKESGDRHRWRWAVSCPVMVEVCGLLCQLGREDGHGTFLGADEG